MRLWLILVVLSIFASGVAGRCDGLANDLGEGVRTREGLYLLDLWAFGRHLQPVIGPQISPSVKRQLVRKRIMSPTIANLLLRKFSDIERSNAKLATSLMGRLNSLHWRLSGDNLSSESTEPSKFFLPAGAQSLVLARRQRHTVLLQRRLWHELAPEHQAALLMHHAASILIDQQCSAGQCLNPEAITRQIVATFFSPSEDSFWSWLHGSLSIL